MLNLTSTFNTTAHLRGAAQPAGALACKRELSSEETEPHQALRGPPVDHQYFNIHSLHNDHLLRRCFPRDLTLPVPVIDPTKREGEHRRITTAYRLKQNEKYADQAAEKQALKRPNTEAGVETKVLGKHKVDFD